MYYSQSHSIPLPPLRNHTGSDPFCCKDQGHPCPLCLIKKSRLLQDNLAADRINDDSISLVQGTFTIKRRFFVDPLHLGK